MFVDLPESELRDYRSSEVDPADFDEFWARTLDARRGGHELDRDRRSGRDAASRRSTCST